MSQEHADPVSDKITGNALEPQPKLEFRISVMRPGYMVDVDRLAITPKGAARVDPDAFLRFASDVMKVALRLRAKRSQMKLPLGGQIDKEQDV